MKLSDKEGLRKVLSNAIPLLCQSGLPKETTFRIDAMIGITIDDHEASTLICFSEQIGPNKQPNIMSLLQNDSQFACNEFGSAEDFNKNDEFNNNNNTEFDNNTNKNFNINSDFNCVNEDNNSTPIESSIETTNNNNISNNNNNDENKDTTMNTGRKRKRPRKSKPYSNTQLNSYNIKEEEEDEDFYTVKHENDDAFQDNENVEWNNNNNIFDDNNNNDNISNALEENTFNNNINLSNNNNQIDNNNNNNNTLNNNNINNNFSNIDQPWTNNNTPLAQPPPPTQDRKNTRTRRASRKYADYLSETLPLEASTYLEQHSSILSTSLNNLTTTDLNSKDHDTDYNNLMQGICDFVMSQSQHIDDKNRPRSRTCHICQATLSNPLSLKNHIQGTHLALKLRRCNLCGETFKWTMQLARHKKRVHGSTDVLYNLPNGPVANSISNGTVANGGGGYSVE